MFKFSKTVRRLALAALIAGSLVSTSFGASRGHSSFSKSFTPRSNSGHSNSSRSSSIHPKSSSSGMSRMQNTHKPQPTTKQAQHKPTTTSNNVNKSGPAKIGTQARVGSHPSVKQTQIPTKSTNSNTTNKSGHTFGDLVREKKTIPLIPVNKAGKSTFEGLPGAKGKTASTNSTKKFPNGNSGISGKGTTGTIAGKKGADTAKSGLNSKRTLLNEPRGSTTHVLKDERTEEQKKQQEEARKANEKAKAEKKKKQEPVKTVPRFDPVTGTVKDVPITASNPTGDLLKSKTKAEQAAQLAHEKRAKEAREAKKIEKEQQQQRQERRDRIEGHLEDILTRVATGGNGGGGDFGGGVPMQEVAPAMEAASVQETAPVQLASAQEEVVTTAPAQTTSGVADLTLCDVKMLAKATQLAGPGYGISFMNQGTAPTQGFKLAAVVSDDGQLHADAKKTILEVPAMAPGEVRRMKFRLPQGTSKYMILMLDADGSVNESDKDNNIAMIERAE